MTGKGALMTSAFGTPSTPVPDAAKKIPAGVCGILLGALGVHKFILGYTSEGVLMLMITIVGFWFFLLGPVLMGIFGVIEGIIYLTKSDAAFSSTYITNKKGWF
jgi:TM2 domain-containing membrane protein YozV